MKKRADGRYCKSKRINNKTVYFYSSEASENKALRDIENQMLVYTEIAQKGKIFKQVADEWEEEHYKHLQYQTAYRYKSLTARLVEEFGKKYIKDITPKQIEQFLFQMSNESLSSKTIKDQLSVCKLIFKYAIIKGYTDSNITEYLSPPKGKPKKERQSLTNEEIEIVKNNTDKDFGLLAFFLLYTGLRKGETLALTYGDIDFKNRVINISKSVEFRDHKPFLKCPKTESSIRQVPLLDIVIDKLPKLEKSEILFSQNGKLMTDSYFFKHWNRYRKATGLSISPHQLRHTFTTLLFEVGISDKDTQSILGHSDIATTRNIYTHIRQGRLSETTDKINKSICEAKFN